MSLAVSSDVEKRGRLDENEKVDKKSRSNRGRGNDHDVHQHCRLC